MGRAIFPGIGTEVIGDGAWLTPAAFDALAEAQQPPEIWLRWRDGVDHSAASSRITAALPGASVVDANSRPLEVANLAQASWVPWALAVLGSFVAVAAVAHALLITVARRRRELAVLRALGLKGSEAARTLTVQEATIIFVGLVVGLPVGLVLGRLVWRMLADEVGVEPDPVIPALALIAIATGMIIVAAGCCWFPGRRVQRSRPAPALGND